MHTKAFTPKRNRGLTTQGWLVVTAIDCVLLLIVIAVVYRAHERAKARAASLWSWDATEATAIVYSQLRDYCLAHTNFPALTADEWHQRGVFDDKAMAFLRSPKVHFHPFASTDPDDTVVLGVEGIWPDMTLFRGNLKFAFPKVQDEFTRRDVFNTNPPSGALDPNYLKKYFKRPE
jgi:hypothetical protein